MTRTTHLTALIALTAMLAACGAASDDGSGADGFVPDSQTIGDTPNVEIDKPDVAMPDGEEPDGGTDLGGDAPPAADAGDDTTQTGPCDDDDPCTMGDQLEGGFCAGEPYGCDDGKACTADVCDGMGGCVYGLEPGWCLIDGQCVEAGASPGEGNLCATCAPDLDAHAWTLSEDGVCDDGDACTIDDHCVELACVTTPLDCDDGNDCTDDTCDSATGCVHDANHLACDDGDACTTDDVCVDGACAAGEPLDCGKSGACLAVSCDPGSGCQAEDLEGTCDDGDACTLGDACAAGVCAAGAQTLDCDDFNECTFDTCDPAIGCEHELDTGNECCATGVNPCDDDNPCTVDDCDVATGDCTYTPHDEACNDADPCTTDDVCSEGTCAGTPLVCDDDNPCTADACDDDGACTFTPLTDGEACDDGSDCTAEDQCVAGACVGDTMGCTLCPPEFANPVNLIVTLQIGTDGKAGNGLDVDQDPETCAPTNKCEDGIDNQLASLAGLANAQLAAAMADGVISILFEHLTPSFDGSAYTVGLYIGERVDGSCDPATQTCDYQVLPESLSTACDALIQYPDATITGDTLRAGGADASFTLSIPVMANLVLDLTLHNVQIEATVTTQDGVIVTMAGILGGAVIQDQVVAAVEVLPESVFDGLPFDKNTILLMIPSLFKTDIDTDSDGVKDASSIGLKFTAVSATVTGVVQ
jgi:hypothetical protein